MSNILASILAKLQAPSAPNQDVAPGSGIPNLPPWKQPDATSSPNPIVAAMGAAQPGPAPVDQGASPMLGIPNASPGMQAPPPAPTVDSSSGAPWEASSGNYETDANNLAGVGANGPSLFDRVSKQMGAQQNAGNLSPVNRLLAGGSGDSGDSDSDSIGNTQAKSNDMFKPKGYGAGLDDAALKSAQDSGNYDKFLANMARAGTLGASALSGSHKDLGSGVSDSLMEHSGDAAKNILARRQGKDAETAHDMALYQLSSEAEKADPNSKVSKMAQNLIAEEAKKAGVPIGSTDGMSLQTLEKIFPSMERYFMGISARQDKADSKNQDMVYKYSKAMGEDLDPTRARSGSLGKAQQSLMAAQKLDALKNQFPDGNIPAIQTRELASALANLIQGGGSGAAVSQINELVPHSIAGDASKIASWFTNSPKGSQQQAFIKQMFDTVEREKQVAQNQIQEGQLKKAFTTHHKFKDLSPDDFYQNLGNATGLSKDDIQNYEKTGKFNVAENALKNAIPAKPGMVVMNDPDGNPHYVPEQNVEAAKQKYQFVMPPKGM